VASGERWEEARDAKPARCPQRRRSRGGGGRGRRKAA